MWDDLSHHRCWLYAGLWRGSAPLSISISVVAHFIGGTGFMLGFEEEVSKTVSLITEVYPGLDERLT